MTNRKSSLRSTVRLTFAAMLGLLLPAALPEAASASPQFAREQGVRCTACHVVPPMLNANGLAFQADGYRLPDGIGGPDRASDDTPGAKTFPLAVWITGRYQDRGGDGPSDTFLPKVELISGGTLGASWSYFVEWRVVSLSLEGDGSLRDRGGRFEDLFFQWQKGRHALKIGQHRTINQVDVSLRLSPSEPLLFRNGLPTGDHADPRFASLSRFSPSSRSPSIGYAFQSIAGDRPGDGLFHHVTVPFIGELSIPLSSEAAETASFELGEAKGVYAETFYRRGHKTVGGHVFVSDASWLATALATYDWKRLYLTAGLGIDDRDDGEDRERASFAAEVLLPRRKHLRAMAGLRVEDVTGDGRRADIVPYVTLTAPNARHSFLIQLQYLDRDGPDSLVLDASILF